MQTVPSRCTRSYQFTDHNETSIARRGLQQQVLVTCVLIKAIRFDLQEFVLVGSGRVGTALADLGSGSDVRATHLRSSC